MPHSPSAVPFLSPSSGDARSSVRCPIVLPFLSPQHPSLLGSSLGREANGSFRITSPFAIFGPCLAFEHRGSRQVPVHPCWDTVYLLAGQPLFSGACGWLSGLFQHWVLPARRGYCSPTHQAQVVWGCPAIPARSHGGLRAVAPRDFPFPYLPLPLVFSESFAE